MIGALGTRTAAGAAREIAGVGGFPLPPGF